MRCAEPFLFGMFSSRFTRRISFVPAAEHQSQGDTIKTKRFAELVDKIAFVGIMNVIRLIGENYKSRRPRRNLSGKVKLHSAAMRQRGMVRLYRIGKHVNEL